MINCTVTAKGAPASHNTRSYRFAVGKLCCMFVFVCLFISTQNNQRQKLEYRKMVSRPAAQVGEAPGLAVVSSRLGPGHLLHQTEQVTPRGRPEASSTQQHSVSNSARKRTRALRCHAAVVGTRSCKFNCAATFVSHGSWLAAHYYYHRPC